MLLLLYYILFLFKILTQLSLGSELPFSVLVCVADSFLHLGYDAAGYPTSQSLARAYLRNCGERINGGGPLTPAIDETHIQGSNAHPEIMHLAAARNSGSTAFPMQIRYLYYNCTCIVLKGTDGEEKSPQWGHIQK